MAEGVDSLTLSSTAALLLVVAAVSAWLPAPRRLRQNPAEVLREPGQ